MPHYIKDLVCTSTPYIDSKAYNSLADAVSAIGSKQTTLLVTDDKTVSSDLTIPSNITLSVSRGHPITIASGVTLTIGSFDGQGRLWQMFTGDGQIKFSQGAVSEVYPEWWGAIPNGSYDSTDAINIAANVAKTSNITFAFSQGNYYVTDSLDFSRKGLDGWCIKGQGRNQTVIYGDLDTAYPIIDMSGTGRTVIRDLTVVGLSSGLQTCGLLIARADNNHGDDNKIVNVQIKGSFSKVGLAFSASEENIIRDCDLYSRSKSIVIATSDVLGVDSKYSNLVPPTTGTTMNNFFTCNIFSNGDENVYIVGFDKTCFYGCFFANPASTTMSRMIGFDAPMGGAILSLYDCRNENNAQLPNLNVIEVLGQPIVKSIISGEFRPGANGALIKGCIASSDIRVDYLGNETAKLVDGDAKCCNIFMHNDTPVTVSSKSTRNIIRGGNQSDWPNGNIFMQGEAQETDEIVFMTDYLTKKYGCLTANNIGTISGVSWNSGTSEETLRSISIPAGTLWHIYKMQARPVIKIIAFGSTSANANTKTIKIKIDDVTAWTNDITSAPNGENWEAEVIIAPVNADVDYQKFWVSRGVVGATLQTCKQGYFATDMTANDIVVSVTGQGTAANDIKVSNLSIYIN